MKEIDILKNILDTQGSIITVYDFSGKIIFANKKIYDYFPGDDFIGKYVWDIEFWAPKEEHRNELKRFLEIIKKDPSKKRILSQKSFVNGKKTFFKISFRTIVFGEDDGYVIQTAEDVTSKKNTESELNKMRNILFAALEHNPAGVVIASAPKGEIQFINSAALKIRQADRTFLMDIPVESHPDKWNAYYPDGRKCHYDELPLTKAVFEGAKSENVHLVIKRPDGSKRHILASAAPYYGEDGEIIGGIVIFPDITENIDMRENLFEIEKRNHYLLEAMPDLMFRLDSKGNVIDYHASKDDLLAVEPEEVIGANVYEISADKNFKEITKIKIKECIESGELQIYEYYLSFPDGKHYFESRLVKTGEDETLSIIRDITERKKSEEKIIEAQKMDSIGNLAGGVAHDFNNMLSAISGYAELILNNTLDSDLEGYSKSILKAVERSSDLTGKLLAFGRRGKNIVEAVDINRIISDVIDILKHTLGKNVKIDFIPDNNLYLVDADPGQLNQVIMNLAVNAGEAIEDRGRIVFRTSNVSGDIVSELANSTNTAEEYIQISVKDDGCGIEEDILSKIYEPFFTTKKEGSVKGTGLGLSTVWGIINNHKGTIEVKTKKGVGTEFIIYLPRGQKRLHQNRAVESSGYELDGKTVLVVDDEEVIRDLAATMLETQGVNVFKAEDGSSCINDSPA